jgi:hypothetical protein
LLLFWICNIIIYNFKFNDIFEANYFPRCLCLSSIIIPNSAVLFMIRCLRSIFTIGCKLEFGFIFSVFFGIYHSYQLQTRIQWHFFEIYCFLDTFIIIVHDFKFRSISRYFVFFMDLLLSLITIPKSMTLVRICCFTFLPLIPVTNPKAGFFSIFIVF